MKRSRLFDNISLTALELNSKVAADVMLQFAFADPPALAPVAGTERILELGGHHVGLRLRYARQPL